MNFTRRMAIGMRGAGGGVVGVRSSRSAVIGCIPNAFRGAPPQACPLCKSALPWTTQLQRNAHPSMILCSQKIIRLLLLQASKHFNSQNDDSTYVLNFSLWVLQYLRYRDSSISQWYISLIIFRSKIYWYPGNCQCGGNVPGIYYNHLCSVVGANGVKDIHCTQIYNRSSLVLRLDRAEFESMVCGCSRA